jgi:hypothetical protein
MLMSLPMGMDYCGVFDDFFSVYSAEHLEEWLHISLAMGIHDEMFAEAPRFLQFPNDVEGLWRKTVLDASRFVDGELVAKVKSCMPVGSPAVVALFMQEYLVLVNRGATCKSIGPILHGKPGT